MSLFIISCQLPLFVIIQKMNAINLPFNGKVHLQLFPGFFFFTSLKAMHKGSKAAHADCNLHAVDFEDNDCYTEYPVPFGTLLCCLARRCQKFYIATYYNILKLLHFCKLFIFFSYNLISHEILYFLYSSPYPAASH